MRKSPLKAALTSLPLALTLGLGASFITPFHQASSMAVYDPANHVQNLLQAARALEQIKIQTEQLKAQINSLAKSPYDHSQEISKALSALDSLTQKAKGLASTMITLDQQFSELYPQKPEAKSALERIQTAAARIEMQRQTAHDLALISAQIEEGRSSRKDRLKGALDASKAAEGETGAIQSSVQTLGLLSEQLESLTALMAAQSRLAALEAASRAAQKEEAQRQRQKNWDHQPNKPSSPPFNPLSNARD